MRPSSQLSPIFLNEEDKPHGAFESPLTPMNPDRQPPHVLAVLLHSCLFNEAQSTIMLAQSTVFIVDKVASIILTTLDGLKPARFRCMDLSMESTTVALKLTLESSFLLPFGGETMMDDVALALLL